MNRGKSVFTITIDPSTTVSNAAVHTINTAFYQPCSCMLPVNLYIQLVSFEHCMLYAVHDGFTLAFKNFI